MEDLLTMITNSQTVFLRLGIISHCFVGMELVCVNGIIEKKEGIGQENRTLDECVWFYLIKGKNDVQARKKLTDVYGEVYDHLKGLELSSKLDVWVPHVLTERNLCRRIDVCDSLLKRHENYPFLKRNITGDEKGHGAKKNEPAQTISKADIIHPKK
ncbi:histone-lysine N-methyltransferase SETMAR [Trichonephila clavipes]|nr:histone-lysine N-methyltransferase SETMAR [Trichonephila clavipes]